MDAQGRPPLPRSAPDRAGAREPAPDGSAILRAARAGDRDAFDVLARRHAPRLVGVATRILGDPGEAEEAAADALLKAFVGLPGLLEPRAVGAWLHRITCRAAVDRLRARRRNAARRAETPGGLDTLEDVRPASRTPGARLADAERIALVRREVDRLPPLERIALILHAWEGLSYEDSAEVLGTTYDSVRVSVAHARRRLRDRLAARDRRSS